MNISGNVCRGKKACDAPSLLTKKDKKEIIPGIKSHRTDISVYTLKHSSMFVSTVVNHENVRTVCVYVFKIISHNGFPCCTKIRTNHIFKLLFMSSHLYNDV